MEFSTLNGYKVKDKKAIRYYDTIADMKSDTTLKSGMHIKTKGYYEANDGGHGEYIIVDDNTLVDDGGSIHVLSNGLRAKLLIEDKITPKVFGAYGDGIHDDLLALEKCRDLCISKNKLMVASADNIFGISSGFTIYKGFSLDLGNATIKALSEMDYVVRQHRERATSSEIVNSEFTQNIVIDCNSLANYGFYQDVLGWSVLTNNIRVYNHNQIGIYIKTGQIRLHNCKVEQEQNIASVGLRVDSTDSEYYNIVTRDCSTGLYVNNSSNGFYECHPVMFNTSLLPNSKAFDIYSNNIFVHPICDTFNYGFYCNHAGGLFLISPQLVTNTTYYNSETMNVSPTLIQLTNDNASRRVMILNASIGANKIIGDTYANFTNLTNWYGTPILTNNPIIAFEQSKYTLPKEFSEWTSNHNISSLINSNFSVSSANITNNDCFLEYRMVDIVLPNLTQNSNTNIFEGIDSHLYPYSNKIFNTITNNGIVVRISLRNDGKIQITPLSNDITSGDKLSFNQVIINS